MDNKHLGLEDHYLRLKEILAQMDSLLIAFSGGVDSTLLLKVAKDVLKGNVMAVTVVSETSPQSETEQAILLAKALDVQHLIVEGGELNISQFVKNLKDRCYVCKQHRFGALVKLAKEKGFGFLAEGTNLDDHSDYRPGILAAQEVGVQSPLYQAGLSKKQIRALARKLGLSNWNRPSSACLASRIPYRSPITVKKLRQIDAGEAFLKKRGLSEPLRVRHYGDTARIELNATDIGKMAATELRNMIVNYFREIGFRYVTLDLEGYRTGSLNRGITQKAEKS